MYMMPERLYIVCFPIDSYKYSTSIWLCEHWFFHIVCFSCDAYQLPMNCVTKPAICDSLHSQNGKSELPAVSGLRKCG